MSDALTDIARDERRAEVSERILELEMKFLDESSQKLASRRIEKYKSFLANGEVSFSIREEA